ncbi:hypothetical protein ABH999_003642 [Bradyrhizobium yuanmingense]|uniref:hypothetical protein n=1 Tax=Bradyrhizobium yuanmingense TaxID=108015 RepID=UPI00351328CF
MKATRRRFLALGYSAGVGLGFDFARPANARQPNFTASFDAAVENYAPLADYSFGTGAAPSGATRIADADILASFFNHWAANLRSPTATINTENQRYMPFSSRENFVFTGDALELTATLPHGGGLGSVVVTANAAGSRILAVSDASAIFVGQVVSFGERQLANQHVTLGCGIRGKLTNGDSVTLGFDLSAIGREGVTFSESVSAGSTHQALAQSFVDRVNADARLSALGIAAVKGGSPGSYWITYPRLNNPDGPPFGRAANGSMQWLSLSAGRSGGVTHERKASVFLTWVTGREGNKVTLNHPVTAQAGQRLHLMPSKMMERSDAYQGISATIPLANTDGLEIGQAVTFGYNDRQYRPIVSKTADSITVNGGVSVTEGLFVTSQPIWLAKVAAEAKSSNMLSFEAIPAGVSVGHQVIQQDTNPNNNVKVVAIDRTSSPQTVTLSGRVTMPADGTALFHPPIHSGQIWSKIGYTPGEFGRDWIALELECDLPDTADVGAWPAFWLFRDFNQLTGMPTPKDSASEIDMTDLFVYWSNLSTNCHRPANGKPTSEIYRNTAFHNGEYVVGNNVGLKTRKIQAIWSTDQVFYYIDGILVWARNFTYNRSARAQIAANLAVGTTSANFTSNGFFPLDFSRFPIKFRLKRLRILAAAD